MLYLQIASPKSSVLNFLDSNSFEVIISIFQRTEKVPDMERLLTIGEDCVIGAGSVVTRDIPPNSLAVGNPCRVIREITEEDSVKYRKELF